MLTARAIVALHGQTLWCDACRQARLDAVRATLDAHRLADGGFARTPGGELSLHHTFLAMLSYELLGDAMPGTSAAAARVRSRQCASGAFADVSTSGIEGTNPTASAVAVLRTLDGCDAATTERAAAFLASQQRSDGGFAAHPSAPVSDVMSTFTALVTLIDLGVTGDIKLGEIGRYVRSLVCADGGFHAAQGDDDTDVEYTYYGLGVLALLAAQTADRARGHTEHVRSGEGS